MYAKWRACIADFHASKSKKTDFYVQEVYSHAWTSELHAWHLLATMAAIDCQSQRMRGYFSAPTQVNLWNHALHFDLSRDKHFGQTGPNVIISVYKTRKLSYRKNHREMRPIYGCPEKFRESWLHAQLFPRFPDTMNVRTNLEVRSFTRSWGNRGYSKNWAVPGYTHAPISPKF